MSGLLDLRPETAQAFCRKEVKTAQFPELSFLCFSVILH